MGIAEVLQEQRKVLGLTITEAARLGGIPRAYLSMIEAGKRAPSPQTILRVMPALAIPTETWLPEYLTEETRCQHLMRLAHLFFGEGSYAAARKVLARAYFVSRDEQDGRYNTEIYHLLGKVYSSQGQHIRALRWFKLLDRATRHFPEPYMQAVATYNLGTTLFYMGQRVDALKRVDEAHDRFVALRKWYEVGISSLWRGNILLKMHEYPEAHHAYRRASYFLRRKEFYGDAKLGEAITVAMLQGPSEAIPLLRGIVDNPNMDDLIHGKAHVNLAAALRQTGQYSLAVQEIDKGLHLRAHLPPSLQAGTFAEATLCYLLLKDRPSAMLSFEEYKKVAGPKDSQDIAAMHIIAGVLGLAAPEDAIPAVIEDDYEQRLKAALRILQGSVRPD